MRFERLGKIVALALVVAAAAPAQPVLRADTTAARAAAQTQGNQLITATAGMQITGTVSRAGKNISNVRLRLRNIDTGEIGGQTTSDKNGAYSFTAPAAGRYVIEALDDKARVIAIGTLTTGPAAAPAGIVTQVILPATAAFAFFSTATALLLIGAGAGIVVLVTEGRPAVSPER